MKPTILVISCAHGSNVVPKKYLSLLEGKEHILQTPRAYDIGAKYLTQHLHQSLECEVIQAKITRLIIDCDRSKQYDHCFSKYTKHFSVEKKQALIKAYYDPFHEELHTKIAAHIALGQQVLHLALFTFAPILKGLFLKTAIALLYDHHRHAEKEVARMLHAILDKEPPPYKIRHNFPFLGTHDYIMNTFRAQFPEQCYLGIQLGINQALIPGLHEQNFMHQLLAHTLHKLMSVL